MIKKMSFLLILCFIIISTAAFAADRADVLNDFNVLKGNGIDYDLDSQLKRSEAVTFITRILGKENEILSNKNLYSITSFPDVNYTEWYAPYVGYCEKNGIVEGFPDGEFKPDEYVSEKAFIKMVLTSLDYKYIDDFNWSNVLLKATQLGILESIKVEDNFNYKRSEVVDSLYNSLNVVLKDSEKKLIDRMIEDEVVSTEAAVNNGFITDTLTTEIEKVNVKSSTKIEVEFNENILEIDKEEVIIARKNNSSSVLDVDDITIEDNIATITTSKQSENSTYEINFESVVDESGFETELNNEFVGYIEPEIESDFFRVSKVEVKTNKEVYIYFTTPVNMAIANPAYYEITRDGKAFVENSFDDLRITTLAANENVIVLYLLKDELDIGYDYELSLSGNISNIYNAKLEEGKGKELEIFGINSSPNTLMVDGVSVIDEKTLQITFSREVDYSTAKNLSNYSIDPLIGLMKANLDPSKKVVYLGLASSLEDGKFYTLEVDGVKDFTKSSTVENLEKEFVGRDKVREDVEVDFIYTHDSKHISVYFTDKVDASTATILTNFVISSTDDTAFSTSNPEAIYFDDKDETKVDLYLKDEVLLSGKTYSLSATGTIKSYVWGDVDNTAKLFDGPYSDSFETSLGGALVVDEDMVKVKASKRIVNSGVNELESNCKVYYKNSDGDKKYLGTDNVYVYDNEYIVVTADDEFDLGKKYYLQFSQIQDYGGNISTDVVESFEIE